MLLPVVFEPLTTLTFRLENQVTGFNMQVIVLLFLILLTRKHIEITFSLVFITAATLLRAHLAVLSSALVHGLALV